MERTGLAMIVAITGGRYDERGCVLIPSPYQMKCFFGLLQQLGATSLVHGNAVGTDRYVAMFTKQQYVHVPTFTVTPYPVLVRVDGPWPIAGHRRNRHMLRDSQAEALVAFPGSSGTANCVDTALKMRLRVWKWEGGREQGEFKEIGHG